MSSCFWGVAWRLELRQGRWRFTSCARGHAATVPSCSVAPGMCCRERVLRRDWHLDQWAPRAAAAPPPQEERLGTDGPPGRGSVSGLEDSGAPLVCPPPSRWPTHRRLGPQPRTP